MLISFIYSFYFTKLVAKEKKIQTHTQICTTHIVLVHVISAKRELQVLIGGFLVLNWLVRIRSSSCKGTCGLLHIIEKFNAHYSGKGVSKISNDLTKPSP